MIQHPYTREQRRTGNFVLAIKTPKQNRVKKLLKFSPPQPKFIQIDTAKKNWKFVTDITQATSFKHNDAKEALTHIQEKGLSMWMVLWNGKNWILK